MSTTALSTLRTTECLIKFSEKRPSCNLCSLDHHNESKLSSTYSSNNFCSSTQKLQTQSSFSVAKGLKSILKGSRPLPPARFPHFKPISKYMHQNHHLNILSHAIDPPRNKDIDSLKPLRQFPPCLNNSRSRPLPTPPVTKHVRWATYHEILEIDNRADLALQGYYDDYDGDSGWSYGGETEESPVFLDVNPKLACNNIIPGTHSSNGNLYAISQPAGHFVELEGDTAEGDSEVAKNELKAVSMTSLISPQFFTLPRTDCHSSCEDTQPILLSSLCKSTPISHQPLPRYYLTDALFSTKHNLELNKQQESPMDLMPLKAACILKGKAPRLDRKTILSEVAKRKV